AVAAGAALTNADHGVIRAIPGGSGRTMTGNFINQDGGLIDGSGIDLPISGGGYVAAGGTMTRSAYLKGIAFSVTVSPSNGQAVVRLRGNCTLQGANLERTELWVQGNSGLVSQLTVADETQNAGTILLQNIGGGSGAAAKLTVSNNGSLLNLGL